MSSGISLYRNRDLFSDFTVQNSDFISDFTVQE